MNRSKKQLTKQAQKGIKKTVRKAQSSYAAPRKKEESDALTAKELKAKFPRKAPSKQKTNYIASKKASPAKKTTKKIPSKRTNPGKVASDSTPAFPHREGERWIKTIAGQQKANRKIQTRKALKK